MTGAPPATDDHPEDEYLDRLFARIDGMPDRIGRRLFWTWLLTNSLTVLGCFLLVLLARSV